MKNKRQIFSYKNIRVLDDKIFNMLDALGPHAVKVWRIILLQSLKNVSTKRLPETAGSVPISTGGMISNPSTGNLFCAVMKNKKKDLALNS